ncbi:hypothetical protein V4331_03215 [Lactococcus formosensis subsp. formosensis]|uniref:hypothetical protein n=1 Tax=Lactococcus formosensis TaxID=1281486 RepID=UPI0031333A47
MKNIKAKSIILSASLFLLISTPYFVAKAGTIVNNSTSYVGTPADIPEDASQVISNTEKHIEYTINDGGKIQDSTGEDIQVPVNISTNIESNSDGSIVGETKYTAYLEEAEVVAEVSENLLTVGSNILSKGFFGINAFAQTSNTGTYTHDKGNHVSVSTTVNWSSSGINKKINYVTGNYYIFTSGFKVKSSSLRVGQSNLIQQNISKVWNLGGAHNWRINCNFPYRSTAGNGVAGGANYSMTITNGRTSYSVTLYNTVWGG